MKRTLSATFACLVLFLGACSPEEEPIPEPSVTWKVTAPGLDGTKIIYLSTTMDAPQEVVITNGEAQMRIPLNDQDVFDVAIEFEQVDTRILNLMYGGRMPAIFMQECKITWQDVRENSEENRYVLLQGDREGTVFGANCQGMHLTDFVFTYLGYTDLYTPRTVECIVGESRYVGFFQDNQAVILDMPMNMRQVCDAVVETTTGTMLQVVSDETGEQLPGNTIMVTARAQSMIFESWDLFRISEGRYQGFAGWIFGTDVMGQPYHVNEDPNAPRTTPIPEIPIEVVVRTTRPYSQIIASCDLNGSIHTMQMERVNNSYFRTTFGDILVRTNDEYSCNFYDEYGNKIFSGSPLDYFLVFINGKQVQNPALDNYEVRINEYGEIVVTTVTLQILCDANTEFGLPVYGYIGNLGDFSAFEMRITPQGWAGTLEHVPEGVYEVNIAHTGGAFKALYRTSNTTPDVASSCQLLVNGRAVDTVLLYTHAANWIFRASRAGIVDVPDSDVTDIIIGWYHEMQP